MSLGQHGAPPSRESLNLFVQQIQQYLLENCEWKDETIIPESTTCPGLYSSGCTGQLVKDLTFRNDPYWRCVTDLGNSSTSYSIQRGCGYRYFPKKHLREPKLAIMVCSRDMVEVVPAEGAFRAVDLCGGVVKLLNLIIPDLVGIDGCTVSKNRVEIPLSKYCLAQSRLKKFMGSLPMHFKSRKLFDVDFVPGKTLNCFMGSERKKRSTEDEIEKRFMSIPKPFRSALLPFQIEGVRYAISRMGRCLIADEMGVGKTVQAIALSLCYRDKWPLLVVVPASLRICWAEEFEKWIPDLFPNEIHIVFDSNDKIRCGIDSESFPQITIISYQMLRQLSCKNCIRHTGGTEAGPCSLDTCMSSLGWKMIIVDESHSLGTAISQEKDSKMTNSVRTASRKAEHLVFLSGTPSLNKPFDLFNQVDMIRNDILPTKREQFGTIYCDRRKIPCDHAPGGYRFDYSGLSRTTELHLLLKQELMIRRMKKDISDQLPDKIRQVVRLPEPSERDWPEHFQIVKDELGNDQKIDISPMHRLGIAKCDMACQWLFDKLSWRHRDYRFGEPPKMVVFAHHKRVMNRIAANLDKKFAELEDSKKDISDMNEIIDYVRIDGDTDAHSRHEAMLKFRHSSGARIALVSVTAGGTGLDFSSASAVAFFEIPPQASLARQAEDRVHRRGQKNLVNVFYLCATNTYDDRRWQSLNKSLQKVDCVHDGPSQRDPDVESNFRSNKGLVIDSVVRFGLNQNDQSQLVDLQHDTGNAAPNLEEPEHSKMNEKIENPIIIPDSQSDSDHSASYDLNRGMADLSDDENEWKFIVSRNTKRVHIYRTFMDSGDRCSRCEPLSLSIPLLGATTPDCINNLIDAYSRECAIGTDLMLQGIGPIFINKATSPTLNVFKQALQMCKYFCREWMEISNNYRDKLYGQILAPPLDAVLEEAKRNAREAGETGICTSRHISSISNYLDNFSQNQTLLERYPILKNAESGKVHIYYPSGRQFQCTQPFIHKDKGTMEQKIVYLCLNCFKEVSLSETSEFEEIRASAVLLFCSSKCEKDMKVKASSGAARQQLMKRDRGICDICNLDCATLVKRLQSIEKNQEADSEEMPLWKQQRERLLSRKEYQVFASKLSSAMKESLIDRALSGKAWQADHIIPVFEGGGQCTITNLRTLCTACHREVTAEQASKRKRERLTLKKERETKKQALK
jgi:superfamily II DNA or RNA helicase